MYITESVSQLEEVGQGSNFEGIAQSCFYLAFFFLVDVL